MTLPEEERDQTANMELSQLKNILKKNYNNTPGYIKQILQTGYNVNCTIASTRYLESKQPKLIGCTALHLAFMEGCTQGFETLLDSGADYTIKNRDGLTVLHQVLEAFYKDQSMFRLESEYATLILSRHSENLENPCTGNGLSHFHAACLCNDAGLVRLFLKNGVSANHSVNVDSPVFPGYSPLHFAVRSYGFETVEVLLDNGADQHSVTADGTTPLVMAIERKLKLLDFVDFSTTVDDALSELEKIMRLLYQRNDNSCVNFSAFHLACTMANTSLLERILENDVDVDLAVDRNSRLWPGFTGLHFAALCNFDGLILLLEKGADIGIENSAGLTAFDACLNKYEAQKISRILSRVSVWRDIVLSDNATTLLELVDAMQSQDHLRAFFESSATRSTAFVPVDSVLWPGYTLLHVAVQLFTSDLEVVLTCLHVGAADVATRCAVNSMSAVHLAFRREKWELVDELLQHHRESNLADDEGLSLLHIACSLSAYRNLAKSLLRTGVDDVNLAYRGKPIGSYLRTGFTPLHVAVVKGDHELVRELLHHGADRYAADSQGFTPIHWILATSNRDKVGAELFSSASDVRECVVDGLSHLHVASYVDETQMLDGYRWIESYKFVERLLEMPDAVVDVALRYDEQSSPSFLAELAGATPFYLALKTKNNERIVELLAKSGADVLVEIPNGSILLYDRLNVAERYEARYLAMILRDNEEAFRRAEENLGLTKLHLACYFVWNTDEMERLLRNGADLNARIRADSPLWPGYTPLHVLVRYGVNNYQIELMLHKLGLDFDGRARNADGDDAVHLAYERDQCRQWLGCFLRKHDDYDENPTNDAGLSYFHVACSIGDVRVVDGFLRSRRVDVESTIDAFADDALAGQSPLHLALSADRFGDGNHRDVSSEIVDELLASGAKVNAKDALGETALHKAVKLGRDGFDVLKKIVEAGADVNALDAFCTNPLDLLLGMDDLSAEQLQLFVRSGCRLNGFTPVEEDGYVSLAFCNHGSQSDEKRVLFQTMLENPHAIDPDDKGRTVIHSLVGNSVTSLCCDEYAKLIEQLAKLPDAGCDVDDQDAEGRTALHVAAYCVNPAAIEGLLIAGADVNAIDNKGYLAFDYFREENSDVESTVIATHVKKLEMLRLGASVKNRDFAEDVFRRLELNRASLAKEIEDEVEMAKSVEIIVSPSLRLSHFLCEIPSDGTVHSVIGHQTLVQRFFRDFKDERFKHLRHVFKLQYRKVVARPELSEQASAALHYVSKCSVQCAKMIVKFLTNADLKNVVTARRLMIDSINN